MTFPDGRTDVDDLAAPAHSLSTPPLANSSLPNSPLANSPLSVRMRPAPLSRELARTARRVARGSRAASAAQRANLRKRHPVLSSFMSLGAVLGVVALLVSTSLPANAFFSLAATKPGATTTEHVPLQSVSVPSEVILTTPIRDSYTATAVVKKVVIKAVSRGSTLYTNNPNGTIQWPFPVAVPIASGFGPRAVANCGYCSTFHEGLDFTPGSGVPIHSIADGVVSMVKQDSGGLGNHIMIDHTINGQLVQSVYAHMLTGSVKVVVGQQVKVAEEIGAVGSTGASTGAHLHLEIHLGGAPVDPFAWLKANAN